MFIYFVHTHTHAHTRTPRMTCQGHPRCRSAYDLRLSIIIIITYYQLLWWLLLLSCHLDTSVVAAAFCCCCCLLLLVLLLTFCTRRSLAKFCLATWAYAKLICHAMWIESARIIRYRSVLIQSQSQRIHIRIEVGGCDTSKQINSACFVLVFLLLLLLRWEIPKNKIIKRNTQKNCTND